MTDAQVIAMLRKALEDMLAWLGPADTNAGIAERIQAIYALEHSGGMTLAEVILAAHKLQSDEELWQ